MIPSPWEATLLALAAYRVWLLLAEDSILTPLRHRIIAHWPPAPPTRRSRFLVDLIGCPWCLGFWVAVAWWVAWCAWPDTLVVAVPFALSTAVGILAGVVNRLADG